MQADDPVGESGDLGEAVGGRHRHRHHQLSRYLFPQGLYGSLHGRPGGQAVIDDDYATPGDAKWRPVTPVGQLASFQLAGLVGNDGVEPLLADAEARY